MIFRKLLLGAIGCAALVGGASFAEPVTQRRAVQGELSQRDTRASGGQYEDIYTYDGQAGEALRISLSGSIDTLVRIAGPDGFSAQDDDSGGDLDAALDVVLPVAGQYTITATSYAAGVTGRYTLRLTQRPAIALGQTLQGALGSDDPQGSRLAPADVYLFAGTQGQHIEVLMNAGSFDPFLTVLGPSGYLETNDDDSASAEPLRNSRLNLTLPTSGTYRVETSAFTSSFGDYTVTLRDDTAGALERIAAAERVQQEQAAAAARAAAERAEAVAREEAVRQEAAAAREREWQSFEASLRTLGAGELFARADVYEQNGDTERARAARRSLVSRFPNSPLAATAAQQLAGMAPAPVGVNSGGRGGGGGSGNGSSGAGGASSGGDNRSAGSRIPNSGGASCDDALARQNTDFDNARQPADQMQRFRFLLAYFSGRIAIMDNMCSSHPGYVEGRANLLTQHDATLNACRGTSSNPDQCVAAMP